jgi:hypothetical protein
MGFNFSDLLLDLDDFGENWRQTCVNAPEATESQNELLLFFLGTMQPALIKQDWFTKTLGLS